MHECEVEGTGLQNVLKCGVDVYSAFSGQYIVQPLFTAITVASFWVVPPQALHFWIKFYNLRLSLKFCTASLTLSGVAHSLVFFMLLVHECSSTNEAFTEQLYGTKWHATHLKNLKAFYHILSASQLSTSH